MDTASKMISEVFGVFLLSVSYGNAHGIENNHMVFCVNTIGWSLFHLSLPELWAELSGRSLSGTLLSLVSLTFGFLQKQCATHDVCLSYFIRDHLGSDCNTLFVFVMSLWARLGVITDIVFEKFDIRI